MKTPYRALGASALALACAAAGQTNTPCGTQALASVTSGTNNTGAGFGALFNDTSGNNNTALGSLALYSNVSGAQNVAVGFQALYANTSGIYNTVAGIDATTVTGAAVYVVSGTGQLGVLSSSQRFKTDIRDMDEASDALLQLRPVTFRYRPEIDPTGTPQFGLVAEEVEKVAPALVLRDSHGRPFTVRYEAVNAMLLNEFRKEHRVVEGQGKVIAEQERSLAELRQTDREAIESLRGQNAALLSRIEPLEKASSQAPAAR
jgi:hypothetical protein